MRDVLRERVRPLVERFVADLTEIAASRIEAELERMGEAFEVALSSYASDGEPASYGPSDVLGVGQRASRPAPFDGPPIPSDATLEQLEEEHIARALADHGGNITHAAKALGVYRQTLQRKLRRQAEQPEPEPTVEDDAAEPAPRPERDRTSLQVNGKKPPTCQTCGFVGGNARGCGRSHPTQQRETQTPAASSEPSGDDSEDEPAASPRPQRNLQATYDMITRAQAGDQAAMAELVRQNIGLVHWVARRYAWSSVPYEDMVQEGLIGLVEAIRRFDVSRGLRLSTFAPNWIRHYIGRAHENDGLIRLPVGSHHQLRLVTRAQRSAGPDAPISEVAKRAGIDEKSVQRLLERGTVTQPATLPDMAAPADDGEDEERAVMAREHIATLPERLRRVMELRYSGDGMTLQEVGDALGVSRERARQLEAAAVRAIRAKFFADEWPLCGPAGGEA